MKGLPGRGALAVGVAACIGPLFLIAGAATAQTRDGLADGLRQQVSGDLKQPKLDSRLASVSRTGQVSGQSAALVSARMKGLDVKGSRVRTVIVAQDASQAAAKVAAEGGVVEATYRNCVQALLPPAAFDRLSNDPSVGYLRPPLTPVPDAILGEGVAATGAAAWHAVGRKGTGVKVAVIDVGFQGYTDRIAEGELPSVVTTVDYCNGDFATFEPHGTGVAEVVHEMAPEAELTLICVDSEVALGQAEEYVKTHGIKIVNHSVGWFNAVRGDGKGGPGTIDGIVDDARANGILWVNSAGNQAQSHWSGTYNDTNGNGFHNFTSVNEREYFYVFSGDVACVTLKWDAWPATNQDFDLYLASEGGLLYASSTSLQNGTQTPTEGACFLNDGPDGWFFAAIDRFSGTSKPRLDLNVFRGAFFLQYQTPAGSINEIAASPSVFAAAAICYQSNALEPFSSRGPTIDNRVKPDISGQDGVSNATFGAADGCQSSGFFGTSAASPHVAGAAALVLGQSPGLSATQLQGALTTAAVNLGPAGKDNSFGSGRLRVPSIVAPTVSSFAPAAGPVASTVTINGSAFTGATAVRFNGVLASTFTVVAPNRITATVPPGASTGQILVSTPDGSSASVAGFKVTPKVNSFSPTSAIRGDSIQIEGTTFNGTTGVKFGTVVAPGFVVDDDSHITVPVPMTATTNKVSVTTLAGTGTSGATFTVILPPTISGFSPAAAPVGTTVAVKGSNLSSATSATLSGAPVTIIPVSATQLNFVVPPGAHSGQIQVTNAAGPATSAGTFKVTPKINSFTPPSAIRGTSIQIVGTTFTDTTAVKFGTVVAPGFVVDDDSHITVPVPMTATTNKVSVTTLAGSGTSVGSFTVVLPPTITGFSPTAGPVGTLVTVNGTNLSSVTSASFDGQPATITPVSATQLRITIPAGTHTSQIQLTNAAGPATSAASFKVTPTVSSFNPPSAIRGASIQILGSTFDGATAVKFGTVVAPGFVVDDDSHITVPVPMTATTNKVSVTTLAGSGTSVGSFTVVLPPTITGFSPAAGPVGTLVTVNGTNLSSVTSATFDGQPATITPVSATQLRIMIPAGTHTSQIQLTNAAGPATSAATFKVTPKVTSFTPSADVRGASIQIHGSTFNGATAVKFGTVAATVFSVDDDSTITATVPATATTNKVSVTTPSGTGTSAGSFTVVLPPTISGFSPTAGPVGTLVTVNGTNLSSVTSATFDGQPATITPVSATQLKITIPAGTHTSAIQVSNAAGPVTSAATFKVTPKVVSFDPATARRGDVVKISGSTFMNASSVKIGTVPVTNFGVWDDSTIFAEVPPTAVTNKVSISTPAGTGTSTGNLTVVLPPVISNFTPASGVAGTQVTINGANFTGTEEVMFNGVPATSFTFVSATQLKAVVPPGATTGPIAVWANILLGESAAKFTVPLAITGFNPSMGEVGDTVVITGTGFLKATGVKFGDVTASGTIDSDTQLTVTVPQGATEAPIVVSNGTVSAPSPAPFLVVDITLTSQRIAFVGTDQEIWVMNGEGADKTRLTSTTGVNEMPAWSPDGSQIAFASSRDGNYEIYVMNADGTGQTRLTSNAVGDYWPSWSPDGSRLAFGRSIGGHEHIWVMDADGTDAVQVTSTTTDELQPAWSPDGSRIAYLASFATDKEIYAVNVDGTGVTNLTNNASTEEFDPEWSPDGSRIIFARTAPTTLVGLYTIKPDGTGINRVTYRPDRNPSWCSRIVLTRNDPVTPEQGILVLLDYASVTRKISSEYDGQASPDCWEPPSP